MALFLTQVSPRTVLEALERDASGGISNSIHRSSLTFLVNEQTLDRALQALASPKPIESCYAGARVLLGELNEEQMRTLESVAAHDEFAALLLSTKRAQIRFGRPWQ
jgi:hypothetical protein